MDKKEAIGVFVKRHSNLFGLEDFPFELFKNLRRQFFVDFAKAGMVKDTEIADYLLCGMIKSHQIISKEDLEARLSLPFFEKSIHNKEIYYERLEIAKQTYQKFVDVDKIEQAEREEIERRNAIEEAKKELLAQGDEALAEKQSEIDAAEEALEELKVKTILDSFDLPLPEVEKPGDALQSDQMQETWWERLHLKQNPFPTQEDPGDWQDWKEFQEITYPTTIYDKFGSMISRGTEDVFQNTIIFGQYGSGKSHLFYYLMQKFNLQKYHCVRIRFSDEITLREVLTSFWRQMYTRLCQIYVIKSGQNYEQHDEEQKITVAKILRELLNNFDVKGILFLLDDLHKLELPEALSFLSRLQPITGNLRDQASCQRIAFYVAGSPQMEREMTNDLKFSGSLSNIEPMPTITIDIALEALNLRLKAFAENPDNPKKVSRRFVENVFKKINNPVNTTFREVIKEVRDNFEKNDFNPLAVNPVEIPHSRLALIQQLLEENNQFKRQMNWLLYGTRFFLPAKDPFHYSKREVLKLSQAQKMTCLEKLSEVAQFGVVPDIDISSEDGPYYKVLQTVRLIKGHEKNGQTFWTVSPALHTQSRLVYEKYGVSPEDYLVKIYGKRTQQKKAPDKRSRQIGLVDDFLAKVPKDVMHDLVTKARGIHEEITTRISQNEPVSAQEIETMIRKCSASLSYLTKAYLTFEHLPVVWKDDEDVIGFWRDFWHESVRDLAGQYLRSIQTLVGAPETGNVEFIFLYNDSFAEIFAFLVDQYNKSIIALPPGDLRNEDLAMFDRCRGKILARDFETAAADLNEYLEKRIRIFLFNVFTLLYGDKSNWQKWFDKDSKDQIIKGQTRPLVTNLSSSSHNEFNQLNRRAYKMLMTSANGDSPVGHRNWHNIFAAVFGPQWNESDLFHFLDWFGELNIYTSHNKFGDLGHEQMGIASEFFRNARTFLVAINKMYQKLLSNDYMKFNSSTMTASFSFCKQKDGNEVEPIRLQRSNVVRFEEDYLDRDPFRFALDDQEIIQSIFNMDYREFVALISLYLNQTVEQVAKTKRKLVRESTVGTTVTLRLERSNS